MCGVSLVQRRTALNASPKIATRHIHCFPRREITAEKWATALLWQLLAEWNNKILRQLCYYKFYSCSKVCEIDFGFLYMHQVRRKYTNIQVYSLSEFTGSKESIPMHVNACLWLIKKKASRTKSWFSSVYLVRISLTSTKPAVVFGCDLISSIRHIQPDLIYSQCECVFLVSVGCCVLFCQFFCVSDFFFAFCSMSVNWYLQRRSLQLFQLK